TPMTNRYSEIFPLLSLGAGKETLEVIQAGLLERRERALLQEIEKLKEEPDDAKLLRSVKAKFMEALLAHEHFKEEVLQKLVTVHHPDMPKVRNDWTVNGVCTIPRSIS